MTSHWLVGISPFKWLGLDIALTGLMLLVLPSRDPQEEPKKVPGKGSAPTYQFRWITLIPTAIVGALASIHFVVVALTAELLGAAASLFAADNAHRRFMATQYSRYRLLQAGYTALLLAFIVLMSVALLQVHRH